jgi:hypothetical protein
MMPLFRSTGVKNQQLIIIAVCVLGAVLLGYIIVSPEGEPINGKVCNHSHTPVLVLLAPGRISSESSWLPSNTCTNPATQDADAIWGTQCDATTNTCEIQMWKVGPHSINVMDGSTPAGAPRPTLMLEGWCVVRCGWTTLDPRKQPSADDLQYALRK